jgi:ubiquinol-cytochrome c reductase iron-sulfur subunit
MSERLVAACFVVAALASGGLAVVYLSGGQPQLEGALLALALGGIGIGLLVWSTTLFPPEHATQARPVLPSDPPDLERFADSFGAGEQVFAGRRLLLRLLAAAGGLLGVAVLFPVRSLGPAPGDALRETSWYPGARLVTAGNRRRVRVDDLPVGGVLTVFPEDRAEQEDSATVLIRVREEDLRLPAGREGWAPAGLVAYSKICTHVGCPVGLYEESTNRLVCPCHQSMFDVLAGARPVFGPAVLPLPQLPLDLDEEGFVVARSDFPEPVGPSFWNRDR